MVAVRQPLPDEIILDWWDSLNSQEQEQWQEEIAAEADRLLNSGEFQPPKGSGSIYIPVLSRWVTL